MSNVHSTGVSQPPRSPAPKRPEARAEKRAQAPTYGSDSLDLTASERKGLEAVGKVVETGEAVGETVETVRETKREVEETVGKGIIGATLGLWRGAKWAYKVDQALGERIRESQEAAGRAVLSGVGTGLEITGDGLQNAGDSLSETGEPVEQEASTAPSGGTDASSSSASDADESKQVAEGDESADVQLARRGAAETREAEAPKEEAPVPELPTARDRTPSRAPELYVVKADDSLSVIARAKTGDAGRWNELYEVNRAVLGADPDVVLAGTKLKMPEGW